MYDSNCMHCNLHKCRKQVVFGSGNINRPIIMLVGEAPGEEEDINGKPFWPQAKCGSKVEQILNYINIKRDDIYISNAVLCRPPNNRTPNPEEIDACRKRLFDEIGLVNPKLLILLGKTAYMSVFNRELKGNLKSEMFDHNGNPKIHYINPCPTMVTYHPSYLIRRGKTGTKEVISQWKYVRNFVHENRNND